MWGGVGGAGAPPTKKRTFPKKRTFTKKAGKTKKNKKSKTLT